MKTAYSEIKEGSEDRTQAKGGGQINDRERMQLKSNESFNYVLPIVLLAFVLGFL